MFANTVAAVESIANVLKRASIECVTYHRDSSLEERTKNLTDFRERGGILVCTDAAARGLDIPNVSHVIQVRKSDHSKVYYNNFFCLNTCVLLIARLTPF